MEDVTLTLRALGIPEEAIERAVERGDPEGAIFDAVLMPGRAERTVSAADIERAGGLEVERTMELIEAYGLPVLPPDEPGFTPEEARVFIELKQLEEIWTPDLFIQTARVYGRLLARIAQTSLQLFRTYVEPRLRAEGEDPLATLQSVQTAFARLLPLSDPLLLGIHRRWMEHELAQAAVTAAEAGAGEHVLPGRVEVALLFCDLKDFTAVADREGDHAAVAAIDRFAAVVVRERGEAFRFMKALGDGFMLAYGEADEAVSAAARVIEAMHDPELPGVHASIHYGQAIAREGDYFGGVVNLAARLLAAGRADELIVTRAVVDRCGEEFDFEPAGSRKVRGVAMPVELYRLLPGR